MKEKRVLVCGRFDGKREGHSQYLTQAKNYGDKLIVVIATDKNIEKLLGIKPQYNEKERLQYVETLGIADKVEISRTDDCFKTISNYKPDIVVLQSGSNKLLYELSSFLFENRIKTNVITIDTNHFKGEVSKAKVIFNDEYKNKSQAGKKL